jgi:nitrite reductase (NADH) large subunit
MQTKKKLVVVGNGMAGIRAVEDILAIDPDLFDITVFGDENYTNYNRILLSKVLAGDVSVDEITLNTRSWYEENNIRLFLKTKATGIDRRRKMVLGAEGTEAPYDALLLATGSSPFILPIPGVDKEGVIAFRTIDDCNAMFDAGKRFRKAAVIGGGLLGLEAARGLLNVGMDVTVIHNEPYLMNLQLDSVASALLKTSLEKQGMKIRVSTLTTALTGDKRVEGLTFADGTSLEADLVVMAVGIRPKKKLAEQTGLYCNKGVVVGDYMQTITDSRIYAIGECAEHRGKTYGLVAPLYEQAKVFANQVTAIATRAYKGSVTGTTLKVSGVDVFSAGNFQGSADSDAIEYLDRSGGVYKKLILNDDKIVGAVMFGDTMDSSRFFQMIRDGKIVRDERHALLFGDSKLGDTGHSGINQASAMAADAIVCGCNGITKQTVCDAILSKGLKTRAEVKKCTKASGSCGGCGPLVDQLLASLVGSNFEASNKEAPMCDCTQFTHEEVKDGIRNRELLTVAQVLDVLEWKGEGCNTCRPALNYYVNMIWPASAMDDIRSRIANERTVANIQRDGTYSVVPRIFGGVTTAEDLIRIGEVAKKYNVPTFKITAGQRIDLLGVKKEDLVDVWRDLAMPSGNAYGKQLRTVKTCVGSEWCRFGTQDSTGLGIRLERIAERIHTPAKFKMAVSGCPRNCAESGIKDLGIVGVEGGWELYVGGNGGVKVRAADLLCTVKTDDEAVDVSLAFTQLYRESARHNERSAPWVERYGLDAIKKKVVTDLTSRKQLLERFHAYVASLTEDPWAARIAEEERKQKVATLDFEPIVVSAGLESRL